MSTDETTRCKRVVINDDDQEVSNSRLNPKKFTCIRSDILPNSTLLCDNRDKPAVSPSSSLKSVANVLLNDSFEFNDFENFDSNSQEERHFETEDLSMTIFLKHLKSIDIIVYKIFKRADESVVLATSWIDPCIDFRLILRGFWMQAEIQTNDKCRMFVLADEDHSQTNSCRTVIFDANVENFLLIKPDLLLSCTLITSAVFCRRKAVLNERIQSTDNSNKAMLVGSLVHEIFQKALMDGMTDVQKLESLAKQLISDVHVLEAMYFSSLSENILLEELDAYLPQICKLIETKFDRQSSTSSSFFEDSFVGGPNLRFRKLCDVEENIWSPKYGIRGKVDLTIEVSTKNSTVEQNYVLPVELKTGRVTSSAEHKGQVLLYNAMLSELYPKKTTRHGALLYLKQSNIQNVEFKRKEFHGLVQLRNDLAQYVDGVNEQFSLPNAIESEKFCQKCPQLFNCCLFQRLHESQPSTNVKKNEENRFWPNLVRSNLKHLSDEDFQYMKKWLKWICLENNEQYRQKRLSDIWNVSANDRESRGEAICDLQVLRQTTDDKVGLGYTELVLARNLALPVGAFNVGDFAVLSNETDRHVAVAMGTVGSMDEKSIKLIINKKLVHKHSDIFRLDQYNSGSSFLKVNLGSLTGLFEQKNSWLRNLIIHNKPPSFNRKIVQSEIELSKSFLKQLNKEQVLAILKVFRAENYVLIKGLPGAGKTSTIVALIEIMVSLNKAVIITSYTHSAVDNIVLKLCKNFSKILRLGSKSQVHSDCQRFLLENILSLDGLTASVDNLKNVFENTPVVAATCTTIAMHRLFASRRFDLVIVDEATLLHEVSCLAPLFTADRFVLVGDSQQLQPLVVSKVCKSEGMAQSLFDRLEQNHPDAVVLLNKQYRMNREISHLSNALFYDGRLTCANEIVADNFLPVFDEFALTMPQWLQSCLSCSPSNAVLFLDTKMLPDYRSDRKGPGQLKNEIEANLICKILNAFSTVGFKSDAIGVMCPYRYQCKVISDRLADKSIEVNTIDKYQGRDKCVILVSFVWTMSTLSSENENPSDLLSDPKRINVLLTRAKQKLILIGCKDDLCFAYEWICKLCKCLDENQIVLL